VFIDGAIGVKGSLKTIAEPYRHPPHPYVILLQPAREDHRSKPAQGKFEINSHFGVPEFDVSLSLRRYNKTQMFAHLDEDVGLGPDFSYCAGILRECAGYDNQP
jgi:hypothetical protein